MDTPLIQSSVLKKNEGVEQNDGGTAAGVDALGLVCSLSVAAGVFS